MTRVPAFDPVRALAEVEEEVLEAVTRVLRSGRLVLGPETEAFEAEFAAFLGVPHCVAVNSGTSALQVALTALGVGPGDEVVTAGNTCPPTAAAIRLAGARPVLTDVDPRHLLMDPERVARAVGPRTRCVLPVHLWGHAAPLDAIREAAGGAPLLEDCAQAHGAREGGAPLGTRGRAACFSFYPTKNLGAYGEAGAVVTSDADLAARVRQLRVYGYDDARVATLPGGGNFRIAELQASVLRVKLRHLPGWIERRRALADRYDRALAGGDPSPVPRRPGVEPAFHQYVVRCRDRAEAIRRLEAAGVGHGIHYPVPLHRMPAYADFAAPAGLPVAEEAAREVLSLPIQETLADAEVDRVAASLLGTGP